MLTTDRLVLRGFTLADAAEVHLHVSDRDVAATTLRIPHPYPEGEAARWIETHAITLASGLGVPLAVTERDGGAIVGAIGLEIVREHGHAELGYWIARAAWGRGYATEAGRAVVDHAFGVLGLARLQAHHMQENAASGRVLEKIGFTREGLGRHAIRKWGVLKDVVFYGMLVEDWRSP
jgi:RimJ/RimL family protein N-acetyltransferase